MPRRLPDDIYPHVLAITGLSWMAIGLCCLYLLTVWVGVQPTPNETVAYMYMLRAWDHPEEEQELFYQAVEETDVYTVYISYAIKASLWTFVGVSIILYVTFFRYTYLLIRSILR
ncbi:MAG: hypothetical protein Q7Q73_18130 [Verrucomicrobiota bacterium JB024]|nr:hypothetical protein [Verrucomicrobiota bacterium JB024]